jgi:hypothetical protein
MGAINRYTEDLLRGRRPGAFRASPDEAALARTAITLRSARPGSGAPTEEFVTSLHKRLAAELGDASTKPAAPGPSAPRFHAGRVSGGGHRRRSRNRAPDHQ